MARSAALILLLLPHAASAIPFVGCPSLGQTEDLKAPEGTTPPIPIAPAAANRLAYYKSADGLSVLGPRDWFCQGLSGSSGEALYLSPHPIDARPLEDFVGPVVKFEHISGEASGAMQIAEIIARVFPAFKPLAVGYMRGMDIPLRFRPWPHDTLTYKTNRIVEYKTPARTVGLGTFNSWLNPNDTPITGVAILIGNPSDVFFLSVRLPADLATLAPAIIHRIETRDY